MTAPVPRGPAQSVADFLQLILDTIVGVYEQAGVALPARRYWAVGGVAADCAQLTVHLTQVYKGLPGDDPGMAQRCGSARTVSVVIQLFRDTPVMSGRQAPSPALISTQAELPAADTWLLLDASEAIDAAGWGTGIIAEINVAEPQGGLQGVTMTFTAPIP